MEEISVPKYILEIAANAIRMAANTLDSRSRETCMDREIDHSERLLKWVLEGKEGKPPVR